MNLLGKDGGTKTLQNFKDPFTKEGVDWISINVHRRPSFFRENKRCEATVYMVNGNTSGKQQFYADDFKELMAQIDGFVNNLK